MAGFDATDKQQRDERLHAFSHALKNRLGSIWQASSMLSSMEEGPDSAQLLAMAEKNYFNGAREIEQLMEDFGVERGIGRITVAPMQLRPVLEQAITNIGFRLKKKDQRVQFNCEGPVDLGGDAQLLLQLFEALLSNASKFSPAGGSIRVDVRKDDGSITVTVTDHGVGLSEKDLQEVFVRYALLSSRSTAGESQARSTLARARHWAALHGGMLTAYSEGPGKGCTFTVQLPAK